MAFMLLNLLSGSVFHLSPGANSVGRQAGNDLMLSDKSVSGRHCEIIVAGETLRLRDLHSTNGTFINGRRVKESPLAGGQTIRIGIVEFAVLPVPDSQDSEESATPTAEFSVMEKSAPPDIRPMPLAKLRKPVSFEHENAVTITPEPSAERTCPRCGVGKLRFCNLPPPDRSFIGYLWLFVLVDPYFLLVPLAFTVVVMLIPPPISFGQRCNACGATWQ